MRSMLRFVVVTLCAISAVTLQAQEVAKAGDDPRYPFVEYLDGKAPEIIREGKALEATPDGVQLRRAVFRLREGAEVLAIIASPKAPGRYPGLLVLHGGRGYALEGSAGMWARCGYVVVAPDLPSYADQSKFIETKGPWKPGIVDNKYVASPEASGLQETVGIALRSLDLLRSLPNVDDRHIGVRGVSLGGYMTTMVCGLAKEKVQAGFSHYGCGYYELNSQYKHLKPLTAADRELWLKCFDAGRRAVGIKIPFFVTGATNDFFFWIPSVQKTLDVIPSEQKNHVYGANANHKLPVPGGTGKHVDLPPNEGPTTIERTFFDYYLKGLGKPLPKVISASEDGSLNVQFTVESPTPISKAVVFWSPAGPDWEKRKWEEIPARKVADNVFTAQLPAEAARGGDWFANVSDERPVTVSSDLIRHASVASAGAKAR